jgi:ubiquinone biosynthesis protein UbiJ
MMRERERLRLLQSWVHAARCLRPAALLLLTLSSSAPAQDIRGLEVCTAEKQMDRRTGCLQANVEFLQQALNKLNRDTQDKMAAADRDLAAARAEIAAAQAEIAELKATVAKLSAELEQMKAKADSGAKK